MTFSKFTNMSKDFFVDENGLLNCYVLMEVSSDSEFSDSKSMQWVPSYVRMDDVSYISHDVSENGYSEKRAMLYLITNNYIIIKGNAKEISIAYGKYVKDLGKFKFN
jgi:hypothetical protein